ncbi:hypothetical protein FX988_00858 [Paraglaciecola mesophila]|uniref:DUF3080 domain-containing protein n=1 Tax=Paraglaciecola mesophila TaxID=197222 RepID=A0A857JF50_9ALTE|nr:DUF3080 family protein [Paraglaciecola mesophila]QHJ10639.1 hypothetical protein FX988_00858 [Paraglaciecola mesophila]
MTQLHPTQIVFRRFLVTIILLIVVTGCGRNQLTDTLREYQQRMANVLDTSFDTPMTSPSLVTLDYPSKRDLINPIKPTQLDVKAFYSLSKCDVNVLIAQRNTPLGRTQLPSVRYIYEREVLASLSRCKTLMPQHSELLDEWLQYKQLTLPLVWANLVQTSDETINALSSNSHFFVSATPTQLHETQSALRYLLALNESDSSPANSSTLESNLDLLSKAHLPAKTWRTQAVLQSELNKTTQWLNKQDLHTLCPDGKASQKIKYLKNVFTLFFIEKIQPIGSELNRVHYALTPFYSALSQHPRLAPAFRQYINTHGNKGFDGYQNAIKNHVQFWQTLFKHCGISPRAN